MNILISLYISIAICERAQPGAFDRSRKFFNFTGKSMEKRGVIW
ncbi:hypothetical protein B425_1867 [Bacillus amyloliquefaciens]|nr:hypothetical protein B425_1867 [Bacillus amyloliquefaciens]